MIFHLCALVVLTSLSALAQTSPSQTTKPGAPASTDNKPAATNPPKSTTPAPATANAIPSTVEVPENTPVITIQGLCEGAPTLQNINAQAHCRKQITRSEFETLVKQFAPSAPRTALRNIAASYARVLTFALTAQGRGLEQEAEFKQRLDFLRLQLLAETLERKLQAEAANASDQEIQASYDAHLQDFEEVTLKRLFIPKPAAGTPPENAKSVAESIRQRAVAGEDLDKLEKEAYTSLNSKLQPPNINVGSRRRGTLPAAEEAEVFKLDSGQFTSVIEGPGSYTIYKVESKKKLPLETAKEEIKRKLQTQRLKEENDSVSNSVKTEFNEKFFGPEPERNPAAPSGAAGGRPATPAPPPSPKQQPTVTAPKK